MLSLQLKVRSFLETNYSFLKNVKDKEGKALLAKPVVLKRFMKCRPFWLICFCAFLRVGTTLFSYGQNVRITCNWYCYLDLICHLTWVKLLLQLKIVEKYFIKLNTRTSTIMLFMVLIIEELRYSQFQWNWAIC